MKEQHKTISDFEGIGRPERNEKAVTRILPPRHEK